MRDLNLRPGDRVTVLYRSTGERYPATILPPLENDTDTRVLLEDPHPKASTRSSTLYFPEGSDQTRSGNYQLFAEANAAEAAAADGIPRAIAHRSRPLSFLPPESR